VPDEGFKLLTFFNYGQTSSVTQDHVYHKYFHVLLKLGLGERIELFSLKCY